MASPHVAGLALYLYALEGQSGAAEMTARILELGVDDVVDAGSGSPTIRAYNGNGA